MKKQTLTYKDAGVDIEKADAVVDWMKEEFKKTPDPHPEKLVSGIGGFAALFQAEHFKTMDQPCLVSSTDGIGTKLLMGIESGHTKGLAQDLVAMCVNDLLCVGAQPLFFLDYFATSCLNELQLKEFLVELKKACLQAGVSLMGGETAELPGLYSKGHFDAAGFSVGVVDKNHAWGAHKVKPTDKLIGVKSSGFHSNGYSLLRQLFGENGGAEASELMTPTCLYSKLVQAIRGKGLHAKVHACSHITGGGLDNLLRVLPNDICAELRDWEWSFLTTEAQRRAQLSKEQMLKTFNCGVGLVLVVEQEEEACFENLILEAGYEVACTGALRIGSGDPYWQVI